MAKIIQIYSVGGGTPYENVVFEAEIDDGTFLEVDADYAIRGIAAGVPVSFNKGGYVFTNIINRYDLIDTIRAHKNVLGASDDVVAEFTRFFNTTPVYYSQTANINGPTLGYDLRAVPVCDALTPKNTPFGNPITTPWGDCGNELTRQYGYPAQDYITKNV